MTFWCQIILDVLVTKPWREAGCQTFLLGYLGLTQVTAGLLLHLTPIFKRYMWRKLLHTFSQRCPMIWHLWFITWTFVPPMGQPSHGEQAPGNQHPVLWELQGQASGACSVMDTHRQCSRCSHFLSLGKTPFLGCGQRGSVGHPAWTTTELRLAAVLGCPRRPWPQQGHKGTNESLIARAWGQWQKDWQKISASSLWKAWKAFQTLSVTLMHTLLATTGCHKNLLAASCMNLGHTLYLWNIWEVFSSDYKPAKRWTCPSVSDEELPQGRVGWHAAALLPAPGSSAEVPLGPIFVWGLFFVWNRLWSAIIVLFQKP